MVDTYLVSLSNVQLHLAFKACKQVKKILTSKAKKSSKSSKFDKHFFLLIYAVRYCYKEVLLIPIDLYIRRLTDSTYVWQLLQ